MKLSILPAVVLLSCLGMQPGFAQSLSSETSDALDYLNELRRQTGLIPFSSDNILQNAAQGHAEYLVMNKRWGHGQSRSHRGYTGDTPLQRMLNAGYASRHNSENVSSHSGRATAKKSINGLMSAIYHRFGFLSFDYDEIGIGYANDGQFHSYVYNMGNTNKATLCSAKPEMVTGSYVYKVCSDERRQIPKDVFKAALTDVQAKNAQVVLWPADNGVGIPPAFYDESPDPLPGYDVSGYPVSVQFNPVYFPVSAPRVTRFEMYRSSDRSPVEIAANFNQQTDVNRKFSEYEHALFPKYRLDWNTEYSVEMDYQIGHSDKNQTLKWSFKTAGFDLPMNVVQGGEVIQADAETLVIYSPPTSARDASSEYLVSYQGFADVQIVILDAHTLLVTPIGSRGQAMLEFHNKRFTLVR